MKCPECLSTKVTVLDRWVRQCQQCGHRFAVTEHKERTPRTNRTRKEQP